MSYSWISPKVEVRDAGTKGIGTFAKEKINRGEIVIVQAGKMITDADFDNPLYTPYAYHCFQVEKDIYICPVELERKKFDGVFNVNHSCEPSCGFKGQITLVSMREILSGEEITYDYAMTDMGSKELGWEDMTCLCGSKNCRSKISGEDWKIPELQEKYRGFFSRYIQDVIDNG